MRLTWWLWLTFGMLLLCASGCVAAGAAPQATQLPSPVAALPTATMPPTQPAAVATPTARVASALLLAPTTATQSPIVVPPTAQLPTDPPPTPTPLILPRLIIPALDLDEVILPVLIVDGAWDLTQFDDEVGWLTTTGQRPGGELAVTLAGHVNVSFGHPGPFINLDRLQVDDEIVYRYDGVDYHYVVESHASVKPDAVDALYVPDGQRLLLVTCSKWSWFSGQYARRLIVTARLIRTQRAP